MAEPQTETTAAVLAGFDGSDESRRAVGWAAAEAAARDRPLVVVQSFEWDIPVWSAADERIHRLAAHQLAEAADLCREAHPDQDVHTETRDGRPKETLPDVVEETQPELVVLGASGHNALSRLVLGSTAAELVRVLTVPLVVVRGEQTDATDAPVVVGVDGSAASDSAVEFAVEFARRRGAPVHALHALPAQAATHPVYAPEVPHTAVTALGHQRTTTTTEQLVQDRLDRLRTTAEVPVEVAVVPAGPSAALIERARGARLLVVGNHGRGFVDRVLLGSVTHGAMYHAPCPVAVVRGD